MSLYWKTPAEDSKHKYKELPKMLKNSLIRHIPKYINVTEISDLKPIKILSGLSTLVEKYWNEPDRILPKIQAGLRTGLSCTNALLNATAQLQSIIIE